MEWKNPFLTSQNKKQSFSRYSSVMWNIRFLLRENSYQYTFQGRCEALLLHPSGIYICQSRICPIYSAVFLHPVRALSLDSFFQWLFLPASWSVLDHFKGNVAPSMLRQRTIELFEQHSVAFLPAVMNINRSDDKTSGKLLPLLSRRLRSVLSKGMCRVQNFWWHNRHLRWSGTRFSVVLGIKQMVDMMEFCHETQFTVVGWPKCSIARFNCVSNDQSRQYQMCKKLQTAYPPGSAFFHILVRLIKYFLHIDVRSDIRLAAHCRLQIAVMQWPYTLLQTESRILRTVLMNRISMFFWRRWPKWISHFCIFAGGLPPGYSSPDCVKSFPWSQAPCLKNYPSAHFQRLFSALGSI